MHAQMQTHLKFGGEFWTYSSDKSDGREQKTIRVDLRRQDKTSGNSRI